MMQLRKLLSQILAVCIFLTMLVSIRLFSEAATSFKDILNNAALTPVATGYEPADQAIANVFAAIITPDMTTYQKVQACYNYLINTCSYGENKVVYDKIEDYFYGYPGPVDAYGLLVGHVGVCDDYSDAFAAMCRYIGLNCYVVGGQTHKASGGYTPHAWCVIKIDGIEYVFDPQLDDNIAKGGKIGYYRFGKTYDQIPGKYAPEYISDKFVPFDHTPDQYLKPCIVWTF